MVKNDKSLFSIFNQILLLFFLLAAVCSCDKKNTEINIAERANRIKIKSALSGISPDYEQAFVQGIESANKITYSFCGYGNDQKFYCDFWVYDLQNNQTDLHIQPDTYARRSLTKDVIYISVRLIKENIDRGQRSYLMDAETGKRIGPTLPLGRDLLPRENEPSILVVLKQLYTDQFIDTGDIWFYNFITDKQWMLEKKSHGLKKINNVWVFEDRVIIAGISGDVGVSRKYHLQIWDIDCLKKIVEYVYDDAVLMNEGVKVGTESFAFPFSAGYGEWNVSDVQSGAIRFSVEKAKLEKDVKRIEPVENIYNTSSCSWVVWQLMHEDDSVTICVCDADTGVNCRYLDLGDSEDINFMSVREIEGEFCLLVFKNRKRFKQIKQELFIYRLNDLAESKMHYSFPHYFSDQEMGYLGSSILLLDLENIYLQELDFYE